MNVQSKAVDDDVVKNGAGPVDDGDTDGPARRRKCEFPVDDLTPIHRDSQARSSELEVDLDDVTHRMRRRNLALLGEVREGAIADLLDHDVAVLAFTIGRAKVHLN